jgi:ribose-phosphate pyrophosphokinase
MSIKLLNGRFESFVFSGGEVHVKVLECGGDPTVQAILYNTQDIITLLMLADALKRMGTPIYALHIPYFPYARQDRVCNPGEALSVKVMADLINSIEAKVVIVTDPHSDVTPALLNNVEVRTAEHCGIHDIIGSKLVICPDAGAEKRIQKLRVPYVMATKIRDVKTGDIIDTKLYDYENKVPGKDVIIIDDICDGGRTFIELAKVLKAHGAASVSLYVTHGIFSKGHAVFQRLIDDVYHFDYETGSIECLSLKKGDA